MKPVALLLLAWMVGVPGPASAADSVAGRELAQAYDAQLCSAAQYMLVNAEPGFKLGVANGKHVVGLEQEFLLFFQNPPHRYVPVRLSFLSFL